MLSSEVPTCFKRFGHKFSKTIRISVDARRNTKVSDCKLKIKLTEIGQNYTEMFFFQIPFRIRITFSCHVTDYDDDDGFDDYDDDDYDDDEYDDDNDDDDDEDGYTIGLINVSLFASTLQKYFVSICFKFWVKNSFRFYLHLLF